MILIHLNLPTRHVAGNSLTSGAAHESDRHLTLVIPHSLPTKLDFLKKDVKHVCGIVGKPHMNFIPILHTPILSPRN